MINSIFMHILYVWKGFLYRATTNKPTLSYIECLSTLKGAHIFADNTKVLLSDFDGRKHRQFTLSNIFTTQCNLPAGGMNPVVRSCSPIPSIA